MLGIPFKPDVWKAKLRVLAQCGEAQTRRLAGLKEINLEPDAWEFKRINNDGRALFWLTDVNKEGTCFCKPRYRVGAVVYVKEAYELYSILGSYELANRANIKYLSDNFVTWATIPIGEQLPKKGCHSPLFLPAWAARFFIQITGVRPERLQEISCYDAQAEGCCKQDLVLAKVQFINLWDSINLLYPWASNPWVFRYEFKQVDRPKEVR